MQRRGPLKACDASLPSKGTICASCHGSLGEVRIVRRQRLVHVAQPVLHLVEAGDADLRVAVDRQ
jgi:hypothetical protein